MIRDTRRALRWSQSSLARRCGLSQSTVSRLEAGRIDVVSVAEAGCLLDALGIGLDLGLRQPFVARPPFQQDAAHARTLGYVARRLQEIGWEVRLEVEIVEARARGWIDLLAFRAMDRALLVIEVKARLDDVGGAQRQLAWYIRAAGSAARATGWRPARVAGALIVLATTENDGLISANGSLLRTACPARAATLFEWLRQPGIVPAGIGLALVDPRSRRRQWLIPTGLDGRRTRLRYSSYADFIRASPRATRRRCP